ncbi:glycosyltransferase involved in cell wall biosynthesis [Salinibacter ruber]|uniref:glycosyltransferase family 4 protein n=1 Tax=Salinibacter ruber TaxID=146919 RepID=UPI001619A474|nr:glycosyltransferase family 4 protein [Salinibacter ruber]MBB4070348.1 glycosyltransferase involved in cell wall biosynthesis [Salinibacter ruber]
MHVALTADPELPVPPRLYGGIERIVDLLARGLSERGHQVTLLAHPDSETAGKLRPYPRRRSGHLGDTLRNTFHVGRLAFDAPDVIHSFGRLAYLTPLLPLDIPKIMSYQRDPTLSRIRMAVRLARSGSLVFTGCSEHIAEQIRPFAPSRTIYNGVPIERFDFQDTVPEDAPLVFLGRIAPVKGTHQAVRVAQKTGRRLVIAGNVPEQPEEQAYFEQEVEPNVDNEQIRYVGPVDDEEKNELLGRAAALLMPIDWEEPFGIVMAEAMACGTPVIGTRRGAIPEVVDEGVTGFVGDTVSDLVQAVQRLDGLDRASTRERCECLFSDQAVVDGYEEIYYQKLRRREK